MGEAPCPDDVSSFLDQVDEVSRLIDGLQAGTISVDYVDTKIQGRQQQQQQQQAANKGSAAREESDQKTQQRSEEEHARLLQKVAELKANRECKQRLRARYEEHLRANPPGAGTTTDYAKWSMWCPSDEEDDMFNNLTPNTPEFRAMERDINQRHERMVERRQLAERRRTEGNAAFKAGQYSEALRCYQNGLDVQRHDMSLQANAALAALKMGCWVQAEEHASRVLHIAEVLHNKPNQPLCVKALQRRAAAYQGLGRLDLAVKDLQRGLKLKPADEEVTKQLAQVQAALADQQQRQQLEQRLHAPEGPRDADALQVVQLCEQLTAGAAVLGGRTSVEDVDRLTRLVRAHEDCEACFRHRGGLLTVIDHVAKGVQLPGGSQAALLQLLGAAAEASSAALAMQATHQALVQHLCGLVQQQGDTAALHAAAHLLHLMAASKDTQRQLCSAMAANQMQLLDAWLQALPRHTLGVQAVLVSTLANCALSPELRGGIAAAVQGASRAAMPAGGGSSKQRGEAGGAASAASGAAAARGAVDDCSVPVRLLELLRGAVGRAAALPAENRSDRGGGGGGDDDGVSRSCLSLAGNLCSHPLLLQWLAGAPGLVQAVLQASTSGAAAPAALGCLTNLLTCGSAQAAAATAGPGELCRLVQLALGLGAPLRPGCSAAHGPQLPLRCQRGKAGQRQQQQQQQQQVLQRDRLADALVRDPSAVAHAALAVSRAAGAPAACAALLGLRVPWLMLDALKLCMEQQQQQQQEEEETAAGSRVLGSRPADAQAGASGAGAGGGGGGAASRAAVLAAAAQQGWLDSLVRCLAALLGDAVSRSASPRQLQEAAAALVGVLRGALGKGGAAAAAAGNAALCLGRWPGAPGWAGLVREQGGVGLLVEAMLLHKGAPACRNAAITLAQLGREDQAVLQQLRELRAFEVMLQYVRP